MTMHLVGPYLSTTGKRKGKQKFRSAAEAKRARELDSDWNALKSKWGVPSKSKSKNTVVDLPTTAKSYIRTTERPNSLNSWNVGAVTTKQTQQYTGSKVIGVTIVHKSCLQPVFNQQEAIDAASMRR